MTTLRVLTLKLFSNACGEEWKPQRYERAVKDRRDDTLSTLRGHHDDQHDRPVACEPALMSHTFACPTCGHSATFKFKKKDAA